MGLTYLKNNRFFEENLFKQIMKNKSLCITIILLFAIRLTVMAQLPAYVPTNGLISWYSFNGDANDYSGNNNNGINNGAVDTTDRYGNAASAYSFNGTSSYITIPTSASLESPATAVTFSAWINLAGYSLVGQPFGPILTKSDNSANAFMYRFTVDFNGTGYYAGTNNWTTNIGAAYQFQLNQWYMITAALDSDSAYFYVNDSLIATQPFATNILNNTLPLEIGRDMPGITEIFNGTLDDIGIWNRALTQQEITNLFFGPTIGIASPVNENLFLVYPNPVKDEFQLHIANFELHKNYQIKILDLTGKVVLQSNIRSIKSTVSISSLQNGIYFLECIAADGTKSVIKLSKE
jgi:hypothetical protein